MSTRTRHTVPAIGAALVCALAVSGCGGSNGDASLKVAQARVTSAQKAVTEATTAAKAAATAFCGAAGSYIQALDRYGDVLNATAPTVGDVRDSGSDLEKPQEAAIEGAQGAVEAQQALTAAEQDLAQAQAALAAAQGTATASGSGTGSSSGSGSATPSASPTTAVPSATVNRVKQAESEFASARQSITDQTPLREASQQFNAAAVALQMSWLRLFSDAGCLTDDQQKQADAAVRDYTKSLQSSLSKAGYYKGEVDGIYGPSTVDAVEALQKAHGLPVTGTVDKATADALQSDVQAKGGAAAAQELTSTAAVQTTLKLAGFWDGPVDGQWTPALTDALKKFQTELGVKATGTVDAATIAALEKAIEDAQKKGSPSATATPSTSTTSG